MAIFAICPISVKHVQITVNIMTIAHKNYAFTFRIHEKWKHAMD